VFRESGERILLESHMNTLRQEFSGVTADTIGAKSTERSAYASQLCVILTEKCNIRCRHCINDCSPSRTEELDWHILESFVRQAAHLTFVRSIAFSGGEPFLNTTTLEPAIALCRECVLGTSVTTNGFWASSVNKAKRILEKLKGLAQLCLSADEFHQEFIPIERIANAITACHELGINCAVVVTHLKGNLKEVERIRRQLKQVEGFYEIQQYPVLPRGRALTGVRKSDFFNYDVSNAVCVSADAPTLNVSGELNACCGPADHWPGGYRLHFGHLNQRTLKDIIEVADRDPIVQALRVWGPARLLELAGSHAKPNGISRDTPAAIDICTICEYLFTDPSRTKMVERTLEDSKVQRNLAVDRMARLGEVSMFLGLDHG
jgi:pyruvate-formate lyase-activating enzyme